MRLTSFTDYSLRVLIFLAADPDRRATISEISAVYGLKENHLTKVVHHLARQGWVATVRGKGGGLTLAHAAEGIVIGRVVRDTEGAATPAECFSAQGNRCVITRSCRLQAVLAEAVEAFYAVLDNYTLADITKNRRALAAILHFHAPPARAKAA